MSKNTKIVLFVFGLCLATAIAFVVAGYIWFGKQAQSFEEEGKKIAEEVQVFVVGKNQNDCLEETMKRVEACGNISFLCEAKAHIFLNLCFDAASPAANICEDVPPESAIVSSAAYRVSKCLELERADDNACQRVFGALQKACNKQP